MRPRCLRRRPRVRVPSRRSAPVARCPRRGAACRTRPDGGHRGRHRADHGGQAPRTEATTGTVTWWDLSRAGVGTAAGSATARFGANGLRRGRHPQTEHEHHSDGAVRPPLRLRHRGRRPAGTKVPSTGQVRQNSMVVPGQRLPFLQPLDRAPRPPTAGPTQAEHLITYPQQYAHALRHRTLTYGRPVRERRRRGSSCTSTGAARQQVVCPCRRSAMRAILTVGRTGRAATAHRDRHGPSGPTAITRY